jgi:hypothetical protein
LVVLALVELVASQVDSLVPVVSLALEVSQEDSQVVSRVDFQALVVHSQVHMIWIQSKIKVFNS